MRVGYFNRIKFFLYSLLPAYDLRMSSIVDQHQNNCGSAYHVAWDIGAYMYTHFITQHTLYWLRILWFDP